MKDSLKIILSAFLLVPTSEHLLMWNHGNMIGDTKLCCEKWNSLCQQEEKLHADPRAGRGSLVSSYVCGVCTVMYVCYNDNDENEKVNLVFISCRHSFK